MKKFILAAALLVAIATVSQTAEIFSPNTNLTALEPVSYTHLTLPTNREV